MRTPCSLSWSSRRHEVRALLLFTACGEDFFELVDQDDRLFGARAPKAVLQRGFGIATGDHDDLPPASRSRQHVVGQRSEQAGPRHRRLPTARCTHDRDQTILHDPRNQLGGEPFTADKETCVGDVVGRQPLERTYHPLGGFGSLGRRPLIPSSAQIQHPRGERGPGGHQASPHNQRIAGCLVYPTLGRFLHRPGHRKPNVPGVTAGASRCLEGLRTVRLGNRAAHHLTDGRRRQREQAQRVITAGVELPGQGGQFRRCRLDVVADRNQQRQVARHTGRGGNTRQPLLTEVKVIQNDQGRRLHRRPFKMGQDRRCVHRER